MLKSISWTEYRVWMSVITGVYYIIILALFYRVTFFKFLHSPASIFKNSISSQPVPLKNESLFPVVHVLMEEIHDDLLQENFEFSKQNVLQILQQRIGRYPQLKHTAFVPAINNRIIKEINDKCSVHLSEEELVAVWDG